MKSLWWVVGKLLQVSGLVIVGSALVLGLQGADARRELIMMLIGAAVFGGGVLVLKVGLRSE